MTHLTYTNTLQDGQLADASEVEAKFGQVANLLNGELEKDNVSGGGWRFDDILSGPTGLAVCSFHAARSTNQSVAAGARNAVIFDSENFDVSGVYNSANGNFQPTVSGIYRLSSVVSWGNFTGFAELAVYRNGVFFARLEQKPADPSTSGWTLGGSTLVSLNGATDIVNVQAFNNSAGAQNVTGGFFCAELVGRT